MRCAWMCAVRAVRSFARTPSEIKVTNLGYSHAFLRVRGLPWAACLLLWWSLRVTTPRLRSHGLILGSLDSLGVQTLWR